MLNAGKARLFNGADQQLLALDRDQIAQQPRRQLSCGFAVIFHCCRIVLAKASTLVLDQRDECARAALQLVPVLKGGIPVQPLEWQGGITAWVMPRADSRDPVGCL